MTSLTSEEVASLSPEQIDEILMQCVGDTKKHSQMFFPDVFYGGYSKLHDQIVEAIDTGHPKVVIAAPRGLGKTSTMLFGVASRHILFRTKKFIMYLSNSATNAELQTENLKFELMSNILVKDLFGSIKTKRVAGVDYDERFSKLAWVTNGGTLILPRGSGQQVRGLLYHSNRPDLLIIDDLEDKQNLESDDQRAKIKEWFHSDVMKCISRYDKNYQFIYIDTLKHEDSLLQDLLDASDWLSLRLDLCTDDYKSNAPEFMTDEEIAIEVQEHREKGTLDVFYREMRNIPISLEDANFQPSMFKYFTEHGNDLIIKQRVSESEEKTVKIEAANLTSAVIVDPAKTVKLQSADSAIVGISVDRGSRKIFVRDIVSGKLYPDQIYEQAFAMVRRLNAMVLAVEVTSLHQFISQPIKNQMRVEGVHAQYVELSAVGKKEDRVAKLVPYYRKGYIYHLKDVCGKLETQLLGFPRSKLWDVMDAFGYYPKLADMLEIYFDPEAFGDDEEDYKELLDEKMDDFVAAV